MCCLSDYLCELYGVCYISETNRYFKHVLMRIFYGTKIPMLLNIF